MFIDQAEFDRRREESNNLVERIRVPPSPDIDENHPVTKLDTSRFRKDGLLTEKPVLSGDLRVLVGVVARAAGSEVAAEIGNCSPGYASMLSRGEYNNDALMMTAEHRQLEQQKLRDSIFRGLAEVREAAREKLLMALGLIDESTLANIPEKDKARIAANIANQLSAVIDRTINKGEDPSGARNTHLHLYAPEKRALADFDIKTVNPKPVLDANATSSE